MKCILILFLFPACTFFQQEASMQLPMDQQLQIDSEIKDNYYYLFLNKFDYEKQGFLTKAGGC